MEGEAFWAAGLVRSFGFYIGNLVPWLWVLLAEDALVLLVIGE